MLFNGFVLVLITIFISCFSLTFLEVYLYNKQIRRSNNKLKTTLHMVINYKFLEDIFNANYRKDRLKIIEKYIISEQYREFSRGQYIDYKSKNEPLEIIEKSIISKQCRAFSKGQYIDYKSKNESVIPFALAITVTAVISTNSLMKTNEFSELNLKNTIIYEVSS